MLNMIPDEINPKNLSLRDLSRLSDKDIRKLPGIVPQIVIEIKKNPSFLDGFTEDQITALGQIAFNLSLPGEYEAHIFNPKQIKGLGVGPSGIGIAHKGVLPDGIKHITDENRLTAIIKPVLFYERYGTFPATYRGLPEDEGNLHLQLQFNGRMVDFQSIIPDGSDRISEPLSTIIQQMKTRLFPETPQLPVIK